MVENMSLSAHLRSDIIKHIHISDQIAKEVSKMSKLPYILVEKSVRRLTLLRETLPPLCFSIALGSHPDGHKMREGDGRTPEGSYYVCTRNEKSRFHLALGISYPNPSDAAAALSENAITSEQFESVCSAHAVLRRPPWDTALGGFIMIHGGGTASDWTAGCIALENKDMEVLFALCPMGMTVEIVP